MQPDSIAEKLLFTTIRIETRTLDGNSGTGTGFAFVHKVGENNIPVLVTNKHVINGASSGSLTFTRAENGKPTIGIGYRLDISDGFEALWHGHPQADIDVVITPLAPIIEHLKNDQIEIFILQIGDDLIPNETALEEIDAIEGICFIGYPNGIWDQKNLLPIVRRGISATPITVDFQGEKKFLIDASVFPGSSGSPVFILNIGMTTNKFGTTRVQSRILFLGIVASVYFQQDLNQIIMIPQNTVDIPMARAKQMIDLGVVFKSTTILETIQDYLKVKGFLK